MQFNPLGKPKTLADIDAKAKAGMGVIEAECHSAEKGKAEALEKKGWQTWLKTLGPGTFFGTFAKFHKEFFDFYWKITRKRLAGKKLELTERVFLAIWARGFGKSSSAEWAAVAEGALLGKGFVLYVCGTKELAKAHLESIRERLESPEILEHYPGLANPQVGKFGQQFGWKQDVLVTASGWTVRAVGLNEAVRGVRRADMRPTLIILDDIDSEEDSPSVIEKKLKRLARSILPTAGRETVILGAQNLIHRNSVFNQIYTRKSPVLAERQISGPHKAFDDLEIEFKVTAQGPRYFIKHAKPTWKDFDIQSAQEFLNNSGPDNFLAEYQHDFRADHHGRVVHRYSEEVNLITWAQFAKRYGFTTIPQHWKKYVGHDWGSTGLERHPSIVSMFAVSAMNSVLPGKAFLFKGFSYGEEVLPEEIAADICKTVWSDWKEGLMPVKRLHDWPKWRMSHEAKSERDLYRKKFNLPFRAGAKEKTVGISQLNHYFRSDVSQPHPFKEDSYDLTSKTWKLGCPSLFLIVNEEEYHHPQGDAGLARWRDEFLNLEYVPPNLTDEGIKPAHPVKFRDDAFDSCKIIFVDLVLDVTPLTEAEEVDAKMPKGLKRSDMAKAKPEEFEGKELAYYVALGEVKRERKQKQVSRDHHLVEEPETAISPATYSMFGDED